MDQSSKEILAGIGLFITVGTGIGIVAEAHTNDVAEGKAMTAAACVDAYPNDRNVITQKVLDCMSTPFIPGGRSIDINSGNVDLKGGPVELINGYVKIQRSEAEDFNLVPVLGGFVVGGIVGIFIFAPREDGEPEDPDEPGREDIDLEDDKPPQLRAIGE